MDEGLKEKLEAATAAEAATRKRGPSKQDIPQPDADLEAQKKEHEPLIAEAKREEEAIDGIKKLIAEAGAEIGRKGALSIEMRAFLEEAQKNVEAREARLAEIFSLISAMGSDPAILAALQNEAFEENRRFGLQKEISKGFWIQDGHGRAGPLESVLDSNETYRVKVAGRHVGDNPLTQLRWYAMESVGMLGEGGVKVPFEEAEQVVGRLSQIRQEAEKSSPDVQRIDALLAEFLFRRLKHFAATFGQRVFRTAQELHNHYQQNPDAVNKDDVNSRTVDQWEAHLERTLPDVSTRLIEAAKIMDGQGFKARGLAKIGEDLTGKCAVLYHGHPNPFSPDDFEEA